MPKRFVYPPAAEILYTCFLLLYLFTYYLYMFYWIIPLVVFSVNKFDILKQSFFCFFGSDHIKITFVATIGQIADRYAVKVFIDHFIKVFPH